MLKNKDNTDIIRLIWSVSKPYARRWYVTTFTSIFNTIVGAFIAPVIIATFLDLIQNNKLNDTYIIWLFVSFVIVQIWKEVLSNRILFYLSWRLESQIEKDLYIQIFKKLTQETLHFHSNRFGGALVNQCSKLVTAVEQLWDALWWNVIPTAVTVAGSIIILWFILWQLAVVLLILSIAFVGVVYFGSRPMFKYSEKESKINSKASGVLADSMSNIMAIKSASAEKRETEIFTQKIDDWRESSLDTMRCFIKVSTVYASITSIIQISALAFAIYASKHNFISITAIYLILSYTLQVAQNLWGIHNIMRTYNTIIGNAREMTDILNTKTTILDRSNKKLAVKKGGISIDNITFTHDEGKGATIFNDFSLNIKPGQKVGLVGVSGSGKTTITKLMMRFADVDKGNICIDGQNIADITQKSLHDSIAYVPQEPLLFHRSIKENIAYTRPDASIKEIEAAAKKAGALSFIQEMENGFDTIVGERGVKLSGGQRQRITIARAILKNAPILILDEATSALDSESEAIIQESLKSLMKNRTTIVVAHRLSTISQLDRIIVMEKGKIIEDGTHKTLIKQKGVYAKLWHRQSNGIIQ